jgi:outer membrane receptor protein involved in Fe transport
MAGGDKLIFDLNSTYIRELETTFCDSCTSTNLANTYGQALKFRLRGAAGWSNGILSTNAAINFANAYADTNIVPTGRIGSLTTADINVTWRLPVFSATSVGLSVTNLFDANPPRTTPAFNGVAYDPSNSDPRGRRVSVLARVQW